jgi:hypothetical protein
VDAPSTVDTPPPQFTDRASQLQWIDVIADQLASNRGALEPMGVMGWPESDKLLSSMEGSGQVDKDYSAFGYALLLQVCRRACRADSILLFTGTDASYVFTAGEAGGIRRLKDRRSAERGERRPLPAEIQRAMLTRSFAYADGAEAKAWLDEYTVGLQHRWLLGAVVREPGAARRHFIVLGYSTLPTDSATTAFFYWLQTERVLRRHMDRVYRRFVESAGAWHTAAQAVRSMHSPNARFRATVIERRRLLLLRALAQLNVNHMIERVVSSASEPLQSWKGIVDTVYLRVEALWNTLMEVSGEQGRSTFGEALDGTAPITIIPMPSEPGHTHRAVAIRLDVLEFILLETLVNCLKYFDTYIVVNVSMSVLDQTTFVKVGVSNDIIVEARDFSPGQEHGLAMCNAAAQAAGGKVQWSGGPTGWQTDMFIPMYPVPEQLMRWVKP